MGKHSDPWSVGDFVLYIESSVSTGKQCENSDLMQLTLFQVCVPSHLLLSHYSMYGGTYIQSLSLPPLALPRQGEHDLRQW